MKMMDITLNPWKWKGVVLVGGTSTEFAAFAKKFINVEISTGSNAAAHAHVSYGKPWLLWVEKLSDIPALAHEALHVTAGVLEARGLTFSESSEEAYTYTMEDIIRQVLVNKRWREA